VNAPISGLDLALFMAEEDPQCVQHCGFANVIATDQRRELGDRDPALVAISAKVEESHLVQFHRLPPPLDMRE